MSLSSGQTPCVVSDQRRPPAHFLAGKVLPTPEAMALPAGPSGLPVRVTVFWDRSLGRVASGGTRGFSGTQHLQLDR